MLAGCRVGHVFPLKMLLDEMTSTQEYKPFEAVVALEEDADVGEFAAKTDETASEGLLKEVKQLREHAAAIWRLIEQRSTPAVE